jgi:hypothetical protein
MSRHLVAARRWEVQRQPGPANKRPLLAQEPVDMWALSKFFAGVKSGLRRQTPKIIVAVD